MTVSLPGMTEKGHNACDGWRSANAFRKGEHLPSLCVVAVLDAGRGSDERLACFRGALLRRAEKCAGYKGVSCHVLTFRMSPATAMRAASARPSSLTRANRLA
jgi:hypothetical protein